MLTNLLAVRSSTQFAYRALRARYPKFCNSGYGALNFGHGAGLEARPLVCAARCVASWRTGLEPTQFERLKQALKQQKDRGAITLAILWKSIWRSFPRWKSRKFLYNVKVQPEQPILLLLLICYG